MRYDLIHYTYTSMEQTSRTAEPLMRAMWSEFPDELRFRNCTTQFMFGSSILVAPKVTRPYGVLKKMHLQEVQAMLPDGETWYDLSSKQLLKTESTNTTLNMTLSDLETATYVRGGTILPILQHQDCMSLLYCMTNDIVLEVYPSTYNEAFGALYLDDYLSVDHTNNVSGSFARMKYSMDAAGHFTTSATYPADDTSYSAAPYVTKIVLYNVSRWPSSVGQTLDGATSELNYVFIADT